MNLRLSGKTGGVAVAVAAILVMFLTACQEKIPGDPRGTLEKYIKAVQHGDFKTIYEINRVTAQQKKYLQKTTVGNVKRVLEENYQKNLASYFTLKPVRVRNIQWGEKFFFTPLSDVTVGEAHSPRAVGDDAVNAEYEKATTVNVPVSVNYGDPESGPEIEGKKIKSINYLCTLGKIRKGINVRIYSHDEKWFFGSCLEETSSAIYH